MKDRSSEAGFSYIDVIIAVMILMVGILALLAAISGSVVQARSHEQQLLSKQVATSLMESIMSVKETDPTRLGWNAVGNLGSNVDAGGVAHGVFVAGFQPAYSDHGPDEVLGTADDTGTPVTGLSRSVTITDICDPDRPSYNCNPAGIYAVKFRSVKISVRYFVGGLQRQEDVTTVLADYSITN